MPRTKFPNYLKAKFLNGRTKGCYVGRWAEGRSGSVEVFAVEVDQVASHRWRWSVRCDGLELSFGVGYTLKSLLARMKQEDPAGYAKLVELAGLPKRLLPA